MSSIPPPPLPSDLPAATTPPTVPGAIPPPVSQWPTTFGVISIVLGGAGTLSNACGVLGALFQGSMSKFMSGMGGGAGGNAAAAQQAAVLQASEPYTWVLAVISLGSTLVSVLLLMAGIRCLKRRPDAARYHVIWAGLRMLMALLGAIVGFFAFRAQMAAMATSGGMAGPGAGFASFMQVFGVLGVGIGLVWSWAYPIVVLIWFNRAKVKAEVAAWH